MSELIHLKEGDLRVSLFAPLERETPLVEILYGDKVLADLSFRDDDSTGEVLVLFHDEITGVSMSQTLLEQVLLKGHQRLVEN
ncbi:MAG: hypothetical protein GY758_07990 [Fuerstiella sp.]|nr:hypothetical protein [Fuerstiella sp.]